MFLDKGDAYRFQDELLRMAEELAFIRLSLRRLEKPPPDIEFEQDLSTISNSQPELEISQDTAIEGISSLDPEVEFDIYEQSPQQFLRDVQIKIEQIENRLYEVLGQQAKPLDAEIPVVDSDVVVTANTAFRLHQAYASDGLYEAENYTISKVGDTYTICDSQMQALLKFKTEQERYEILFDRLSSAHREDFKRIDTNIESPNSLREINADTSFSQQVEKLGNLAPKGSSAVQALTYILDARDSNAEQFNTYRFSRSDRELQIERDGAIILHARDGKISQTLSLQDQHNFERFNELLRQYLNENKLQHKETKAKKLAIRR